RILHPPVVPEIQQTCRSSPILLVCFVNHSVLHTQSNLRLNEYPLSTRLLPLPLGVLRRFPCFPDGDPLRSRIPFWWQGSSSIARYPRGDRRSPCLQPHARRIDPA